MRGGARLGGLLAPCSRLGGLVLGRRQRADARCYLLARLRRCFFRARVRYFRAPEGLMSAFGWNRGFWLRRIRRDVEEVVLALGASSPPGFEATIRRTRMKPCGSRAPVDTARAETQDLTVSSRGGAGHLAWLARVSGPTSHRRW